MTTVNALNTITGLTARLPKRIVDHAVLGEHLVEVDDSAKSYAPEMFKQTTPEEYESTPRRGRKKETVDDSQIEEDN